MFCYRFQWNIIFRNYQIFQVWDIGGQSIASEMIDKYIAGQTHAMRNNTMPKIAGAQAALIVYDVTNMRSFDNVQDWLQVVKRVTKNEEKARDFRAVWIWHNMENSECYLYSHNSYQLLFRL